MKQGSDEWHLHRSQGIGASESASVLNKCPYMTRDELLLKKLGKGKPFQTNPAVELGKKFEGAARARAEIEFDCDFDTPSLVHPNYQFIRASFDGLNVDNRSFIEIKYVGLKKFETLSEHHWIQMQHQHLTLGNHSGYYVPFTLKSKSAIDKIRFEKVEMDKAFIDSLVIELSLFWSEVEEARGQL